MISYIIFNVLNVIIQTIKSIATIKCNKYVAAIINAIAYGLYTYIVILMTADGLSLWFKIFTVATANLIGVFLVKYFEERGNKEKLWKVEATVIDKSCYDLLCINQISCNCQPTSNGKFIINCFCSTKNESAIVKEILTDYGAKYFVSESKVL